MLTSRAPPRTDPQAALPDPEQVLVVEHRPRYGLLHSALEVGVPEGRFVIESAPIPDQSGRARGVVAEGPVGTRRAGRFRLFRYEIRRWPGGSIPDSNEAIGSPLRVTNDLARAQEVLDLVPSVPTPVWGRDELHTGDMWTSNSLISWLLARAGVDTDQIQPPSGGRAPVGTPDSSSHEGRGRRLGCESSEEAGITPTSTASAFVRWTVPSGCSGGAYME
jgi:hypothetical protein